MQIINGILTYIKYGSAKGYKCEHCGVTLTKPSQQEIYNLPWSWYADGSGRIRCSACRNLAVRI